MNPDDIEEGDDVYFECKVHANPNAYKVIWKHNVSDIYIYIYNSPYRVVKTANKVERFII